MHEGHDANPVVFLFAFDCSRTGDRKFGAGACPVPGSGARQPMAVLS